MTKLFVIFNPAKILIWFTFLNALLRLKKKSKIDTIFFTILSFSFITEILTSFFFYFGISVSLITTINIIVHNLLWLYILFLIQPKYKFAYKLIFILLSLSMLNLFFYEGFSKFNYITFVISAFCYVITYLFLCINKLKDEDLAFFKNNTFLLITAPLTFFIGLSFMFAFQSKLITTFIVYEKITLFMTISYVVNFVYYGMLNYYIKRSKNG